MKGPFFVPLEISVLHLRKKGLIWKSEKIRNWEYPHHLKKIYLCILSKCVNFHIFFLFDHSLFSIFHAFSVSFSDIICEKVQQETRRNSLFKRYSLPPDEVDGEYNTYHLAFPPFHSGQEKVATKVYSLVNLKSKNFQEETGSTWFVNFPPTVAPGSNEQIFEFWPKPPQWMTTFKLIQYLINPKNKSKVLIGWYSTNQTKPVCSVLEREREGRGWCLHLCPH